MLTRTHATALLPDKSVRRDYRHRESLAGWPELVVYWANETGIAVGVAPVAKATAARSAA